MGWEEACFVADTSRVLSGQPGSPLIPAFFTPFLVTTIPYPWHQYPLQLLPSKLQSFPEYILPLKQKLRSRQKGWFHGEPFTTEFCPHLTLHSNLASDSLLKCKEFRTYSLDRAWFPNAILTLKKKKKKLFCSRCSGVDLWSPHLGGWGRRVMNQRPVWAT